jgi:hypothetical protein
MPPNSSQGDEATAQCNALALEIAGLRFRKRLADAEIVGVWSLAWLPESSGNITHPGFVVEGANEDPIERLNPHNLPMLAFLDAFARQPEAVIDLLKIFRRYIREKVGRPGPSLVHAALIAGGTPKEAAHNLAEAETKGSPTAAAIASAGRRLRRHRSSLKESIKGPLWPYVAATGTEPVPRNQASGADKKTP